MGKYLFFDMDGTLIDPSTGKIPDSAVRALNMAKENGHHCFICTGRAYALGMEYDGIVHMPGIVYCNGASASYEGKVLFEEAIPHEDVMKIMDVVSYLGGSIGLLTQDHTYLNETAYIQNRKWAEGMDITWDELYRKRDVRFMSLYENEPVLKMDICFTNALIADIFFSRVPDTVNLVMAGGYYAGLGNLGGEITGKGVTKASGIRKVLDVLKGRMEDCYVFGDSSNDMEMICECPNSVAMGNGTEQIKAAASYVTDQVNEDGIYNAMKHFNLI